MKKIRLLTALFVSLLLVSEAIGDVYYQIDKEIDSEVFVINGEVYRAQTYCFNLYEGDLVRFIEGSPYGACVSAKIYNRNRNSICDLWCE